MILETNNKKYDQNINNKSVDEIDNNNNNKYNLEINELEKKNDCILKKKIIKNINIIPKTINEDLTNNNKKYNTKQINNFIKKNLFKKNYINIEEEYSEKNKVSNIFIKNKDINDNKDNKENKDNIGSQKDIDIVIVDQGVEVVEKL